MASNSENNSNKNIRSLRTMMILSYALIIIFAITMVSNLAIKKTDIVLKNKVTSLTASLNVQMKLNLDSYLSRMETLGTLAFANEDTYKYDATSSTLSEYDKIDVENQIAQDLLSLCIFENFVDYGIVYRNNHTVGKISNGTANLFGESIFDDLSSMITRQRSGDGWYTGYKNDYTRIYYVKSIHENAILVISFYSSELENVFDNPETLKDMTIQLTDNNYNILYSSDGLDRGQRIIDPIYNIAEAHTSASVMDNDYLVTISSCGDDWYVICSVPTAIILKEKNDIKFFIHLISIISALLSFAIGSVVSYKITRPVDSTINTLINKAHIDQLTGILNKRSFEELAQSSLNDDSPFAEHTLILIDLDNFKGVNDNLGHNYGDSVLAGTGSILRRLFSSSDVVGRIGGDEFCVMLNKISTDDLDQKDFAAKKCEEICEAFRNFYTGDDSKYKISASLGAATFPDDGKTFEELYLNADKALYHSKRHGKDTFCFYDKIADKEEKTNET